MRFSPLLIAVVAIALAGAALMMTGAVVNSMKAVLAGVLFITVAIALVIGEMWWVSRPRR